MDKRARMVLRLLAAIGGGLALLMPQHGDAAGTSSRQAVQFHCTLAGKAKGGPVLDRTAVCARFARAIETALGVRLVEILTPPQAGKGRWISIEVRLGPPAHAEARFASRLGRAATNPCSG